MAKIYTLSINSLIDTFSVLNTGMNCKIQIDAKTNKPNINILKKDDIILLSNNERTYSLVITSIRADEITAIKIFEINVVISSTYDFINDFTMIDEVRYSNICNELFSDFIETENNTVPKSLSEREFSYNVIYFGAPGTGKSHKVDVLTKGLDDMYVEKVTFHPEYDHASFVGCYKPISEDDNIKYEFLPQVFTNIYTKAWNDSLNTYYLIIDEINRGNCAEIFGDLFQLLDREDSGESKYEITPSEDLKKYLVDVFDRDQKGIANGKMRLPSNLVILATMNTSDQSLYPMDSAFKRRWDWVYVPIEYGEECSDGRNNDSWSFKVELDKEEGKDARTFQWIEFIEKVNKKISDNPNLGADKQIGNYFIKPKQNGDDYFENINLKDFVHKVMFYLWNDVFKDEEEDRSIFKGGKSYQDLFPIKDKGLHMLEGILKDLGVEYDENVDADFQE